MNQDVVRLSLTGSPSSADVLVEEHRGVVVTIIYDPSNPKGSNDESLAAIERGEFGPFYI